MTTIKCLLAGAAAAGALLTASSALAQGAALNYENADLKAVADDISNRTNYTFVYDPALAGTVTIVSPPDANLGPDEVWRLFQAALRLNGFTAVPLGDREYQIVRTEQGLREPGASSGNGGRDDGSSTVTQLVPLRFVGAAEAMNAVRALVAQTGVVTAIPESNTLIIADRADNVARVVSILEDLDRDTSIVRSVTLRNALAADVADTVQQIAQQGGERRARLSVVPQPTTNQIVLRGDPDEVARVLPIIRQLDETGGATGAFDAIYLNHAQAETVVELLEKLLPQQLGGEGAQQQTFGPQTTVAADVATNSVVVNGPPDVQRLIRSLVAQLDIRRPQVLIEAIVVEVSNSTARDLGVQYLSGGDGFPATAASFPGSGPNLISAAGAAYFLSPDGANSISGGRTVTTENGTVIVDEGTNNPALQTISGQLVEAAVGQLLNFNGFLGGFADVTDDGAVYGVLLNALQSDANSNILQTAHVKALDNEESRIQVGQNVPITSGRASGQDFSGGVFTEIDREDIGTILKVTPSINEGNTIQLDVSLEISSIGSFAGPNQDIIIAKNLIENKFTAEDGQISVIGGLVGSNQQDTQSKVPLLGDIPLLGNLFKGQSRSKSDTTLMIFIRPTIIRDSRTDAAVTARKYDYVRQEQMKADRRDEGRPSRLDVLERDLLGTGTYVPVPRQMSAPPSAPTNAPADDAPAALEPTSRAPARDAEPSAAMSPSRGLRGTSGGGVIVGEAAVSVE